MRFDGIVELEPGPPPAARLQALATYVARQLQSLFPTGAHEADAEAIAAVLPATLHRLQPVLRTVKCFQPQHFNCFHSLQYASFLYLLANERSRNCGDMTLPERLFLLNRALNAIDLYYAVEMPQVFFISHGLGTVLGNVKYGERLVFFQNVTVGRVGDHRPEIGSNVVIYPGAVITGRTVVGDHCVVSAGTVLHNVQVPPHSIVRTENGKAVIQENRKDYIGLYLSPVTG